MSHGHDATLRQIFQHPIAMNLKWNDVEHMLRSLGASLESAHGGREKVRLNGKEMTFHVPHGKTLSSKDEVMQLRHFLESAGVSKGETPLT